jgi:hypothetical protein
MQRVGVAFGLVVLGALAFGCVEHTAVRRSLLIPGATLPARLGAPLDQGEGRAGAELSALNWPYPDPDNLGSLNPANEGDPGVFVPDLHLGAFFYVGLLRFWEVGLRVQYTNMAWSDQNVAGVIDLPDSQDQGLYEVGFGNRINLIWSRNPSEPFNLAVLTELNIASVPEAVFCEVGTCDGYASKDPGYSVYQTRHDFYFVPNLALSAGAHFHEMLFVDALVGATTSLTNIGFDRLENIDDDTTDYLWVGYFGLGASVRYEWIFGNIYAHFPFEREAKIDFGPRITVQTGYAF